MTHVGSQEAVGLFDMNVSSVYAFLRSYLILECCKKETLCWLIFEQVSISWFQFLHFPSMLTFFPEGMVLWYFVICSKTTNNLYVSLNCNLLPVLFYFEIQKHRASFVIYCYPCITGMFRLSSRALARAWRYTCLNVHMHVPEVIHASMFTCMCLKVSMPLCSHVRAWRYSCNYVHMHVPEGINATSCQENTY